MKLPLSLNKFKITPKWSVTNTALMLTLLIEGLKTKLARVYLSDGRKFSSSTTMSHFFLVSLEYASLTAGITPCEGKEEEENLEYNKKAS